MVGSRLQHLFARPSIARILFGLTNGEAAIQPHRLQAGLIFDSTSSETRFCLSLGYFCLTC